MGIDEVTTLIGTLGFPIVMSLIFVFRLEKAMGVLKDSVESNSRVIDKAMVIIEQMQKGER